jgi:hypothetical protein
MGKQLLNRFEEWANDCGHTAYFSRRPKLFSGATLCAERLTKRLYRNVKTNLVSKFETIGHCLRWRIDACWDTIDPMTLNTECKGRARDQGHTNQWVVEPRPCGSLCYRDPDFMRSLGADAMKSKG